MNLPNKITTMRLILIPVFIVSFLFLGLKSWVPAVIFMIASLTDFLDGYIARRDHLVTTFGKFLDPLADKMLTQAAFIMLVDAGKISGWMVVLIVCRELLITGFRTIAVSRGVTIAASRWGKYKTVFQMASIVCFLTQEAIFPSLGIPVAEILLNFALFFTLWSAIDYIVKNRSVLDLTNI